MIRDQRRAIDRLLMPRSVAVVGASESSRVGRASLENLKQLGFEGAIFPVNPKYRSVLGLDCYPSIEAIPAEVDAALVATGPEQVLSVVEECVRKGVGGVVVSSDGFGERGADGAERQRSLHDVAAASGMAVCGPNCMGILNLANGGALYIGVLDRPMQRGPVSVVLQSGSLGLALANNDLGLHFRYLISSGNEALSTAADFMDFLVRDAGTRVIGLVLESIREGDRILELAEAAACSEKPVILLKLGTSETGRRLATSHTGALAGSGRVTADVCRESGIILTADLEEFATTCHVLSQGRRPVGPNAGVVTLSGGSGVLFADLAAGSRLNLVEWQISTASALEILVGRKPANPVDAWSGGDFAATALAAGQVAAADPGTDFIVLLQDLPPAESAHRSDVPAAVVKVACTLRESIDKPVAVWGSVAAKPDPALTAPLKSRQIPYLTGGRSAIAALASWAAGPAPRRRSARARPAHDANAAWDRALLIEHSIPMIDEVLVEHGAAAEAAAPSLGAALVMKIKSPDLPHKSELGGVRRAVRPSEAQAEFEALVAAVRHRAPAARIEGVIMQPEAPAGALEMTVGAVRDPDWGWVVSCGYGGVMVELVADIAFAKAPVDRSAALDLLQRLRSWPLLAGYRGAPPRDSGALADVVVRVSELVLEAGAGISQLDLNPVLVYPEGRGVLVVDFLAMN